MDHPPNPPPPLTSEDKLVDESSREVSKCLRHAGRPAVFAVGARPREEDARHTGQSVRMRWMDRWADEPQIPFVFHKSAVGCFVFVFFFSVVSVLHRHEKATVFTTVLHADMTVNYCHRQGDAAGRGSSGVCLG